MAKQNRKQAVDQVGGDIYVVRFSSADDEQTKAWKRCCAKWRARRLERERQLRNQAAGYRRN